VIYGWTALALVVSSRSPSPKSRKMAAGVLSKADCKVNTANAKLTSWIHYQNSTRHNFWHSVWQFSSSACEFHSGAREARHVEQSTNTAHRICTCPPYQYNTALRTIQSFRVARSDPPRDIHNPTNAPNVAHLVCDKECYETLEL
jgi:hypothetical protein